MARIKIRKHIKKIIFYALVIIFLWIILARITNLEAFLETLRQGKIGWIALALLSQIVFFCLMIYAFRQSFANFNIQRKFEEIMPVYFVATFVNLAVPSAGISSTAAYAKEAEKSGHNYFKAAAATLTTIICDLTSTFIILLISLYYLSQIQNISRYYLIATALLFLIIMVLVLSFYFAYKQKKSFASLLRKLIGIYNLIIPKLKIADTIDSKKISKDMAEEFFDAGEIILSRKRNVLKICFFAIVAKIASISALFFVFYAFGVYVNFSSVVAGYSIGQLFLIVSITPEGFGIVEPVMTLAFVSLNVPAHIAAAAALIFRGMSFWLPFFLGFFFLRKTKILE